MRKEGMVMNCPNCNKVNSENAIFCEHCGTRLVEVSEEQQTTTAKKISKKILVSGALVGIVLCVILFFLFLPKYPKEEQLKADFIKEIVDDEENFSVSKLTIDSEMEMGEKYVMVASIIYDDGEIEYQEKYCFTYVKSDDWVIENIEEHDEDTWKTRAIVEPSADEFGRRSLNYFDDSEAEDDINRNWLIEDDTEITSKESKVDLENQKATFIYVFRRETSVFSVESEVEFFYEFEDKSWSVTDYSVLDYKEDINILHSWTGVGENYYDKENFKFKILNIEDKKITAEITHGDVVHQMSGDMTLSYLEFDLFDNADEKYCFKGQISEDGEVTGTIDTNYKPNAMFYFTEDRYDLTLKME